jgi:hypothetical protein
MNAGVKFLFYWLPSLEVLFHNYWHITRFDPAIPSFFRNNPHGRTRATLTLATCTHDLKSVDISLLKGGEHLR